LCLFAGDINAWLKSKFHIYYTNKFLYEITYNTQPSDRKNTNRNIQYVFSRAKVLAVFVTRQMSENHASCATSFRCIDQQLEVHLKQYGVSWIEIAIS
ncbi:hypothetical protein ALC57_18806, partial [Trachymyrmex cornetzi]